MFPLTENQKNKQTWEPNYYSTKTLTYQPTQPETHPNLSFQINTDLASAVQTTPTQKPGD
jgi:hypothetical protein